MAETQPWKNHGARLARPSVPAASPEQPETPCLVHGPLAAQRDRALRDACKNVDYSK
jgi:hypothetical protein